MVEFRSEDFAGREGRVPQVNATEDGVDWVRPVQRISDVHDGPPTLTGNAGRFAQVSKTEDGFEWVAPSMIPKIAIACNTALIIALEIWGCSGS